jgi:hypothetical protein
VWLFEIFIQLAIENRAVSMHTTCCNVKELDIKQHSIFVSFCESDKTLFPCKKKVKFAPKQTIKAEKGRRGIVLLFL